MRQESWENKVLMGLTGLLVVKWAAGMVFDGSGSPSSSSKKKEPVDEGTGDRRIGTVLAQAGCEVDEGTGALTPAIHMSSTFERDRDLGFSRGFVYTRAGNPTRSKLEQVMAELERGSAGLAFSSGSAAAGAIFQTLGKGFVVFPKDLYHGNRTLLQEIFGPWGLESKAVDMKNEKEIRAAVREAKSRSKEEVVIFTETPSNPLLEITNLDKVSEIAREFGAIHINDATWLSPVLCRPLLHGCDVVLHSTTKYIGGHSDLLGGLVVFGNSEKAKVMYERVKKVQICYGVVPSPFDCWLTLRGLRSLGARMKLHSENALRVARFLKTHPNVEQVFYPGLSDHPGHTYFANELVNGSQLFGGMMSILVAGGEEAAVRVQAKTKIFKRATSLGGTESLIEHRASIERASSSVEITTPGNLLRLSIGLEDADELVDDLNQALA